LSYVKPDPRIQKAKKDASLFRLSPFSFCTYYRFQKVIAGKRWTIYYFDMKSIEEIESAIKSLPPEDLTRFRKWYDEFETDRWDRKIEEDVRAGRLEKPSDQAVKDLHEGRCTEL
jgi:hypothetical protein